MPFGVTCCFDPAAATAIESLWQALDRLGIDSDRQRLGYPAHITLAVYPDSVPADRLVSVLAQVASGWRPLRLALSGLAVFPAPAATLWLAPSVPLQLFAWHAAVQAALPCV